MAKLLNSMFCTAPKRAVKKKEIIKISKNKKYAVVRFDGVFRSYFAVFCEVKKKFFAKREIGYDCLFFRKIIGLPMKEGKVFALKHKEIFQKFCQDMARVKGSPVRPTYSEKTYSVYVGDGRFSDHPKPKMAISYEKFPYEIII